MIIALFPKTTPTFSKDLPLKVVHFFQHHGVDVVVEDEWATPLQAPPLSSADPEKIDFLITMGGDGSILRVAHRYSHLKGAILGINLGHLGFMADVQISELSACLEDLLAKEFDIQRRLMLAVNKEGHAAVAINDCVLHRARNPSLIEIALYVDDLLLNHFQADGVIIATPNGSTAYSLAAGGPIISPDVEAFVITPICPHTISNRPIVLPASRTLRIEYISASEPIEVVTDGVHTFELKTGEAITLTEAPTRFNIVQLKRIDYFTTLRKKLAWSGKLR